MRGGSAVDLDLGPCPRGRWKQRPREVQPCSHGHTAAQRLSGTLYPCHWPCGVSRPEAVESGSSPGERHRGPAGRAAASPGYVLSARWARAGHRVGTAYCGGTGVRPAPLSALSLLPACL